MAGEDLELAQGEKADALLLVHTFAGLAERQARHEAASRKHAALRRKIESVRGRLASVGDLPGIWADVDQIRSEMDEVAAANPNASGRIWDRLRRHMKGEFTRKERFFGWLRGLELIPLSTPGERDGPRRALAKKAESAQMPSLKKNSDSEG